MTLIRSRQATRPAAFTFLLAMITVVALAFGTFTPRNAEAQNVSWLSGDTASYLTSSGIVVYVPSWLPGGVSGVSPEIYAGGGSYSIYFYVGGGFLYITGTAGLGFPGGSEANLNVELFVNSSVLGYPAINDIGIPAGSTTPIYDKTMWVADGVLYTVSLLGVGTDSVSLANSSVALTAPAPAPAPQPTAPPVWQPDPTSPPVVTQPEQPVSTNTAPTTTTSTTNTTSTVQNVDSSTGQTSTITSSAAEPTVPGPNSGGEHQVTPTAAPFDDGTGGAWYVGFQVDSVSDGTDGPPPPILDDGTGGAG